MAEHSFENNNEPFKDKSIDELIKYIADIWEIIESKCGDTKREK